MNRRAFLKSAAGVSIAVALAGKLGKPDLAPSEIWGRDLCIDFGGGLWAKDNALWTEIDEGKLANAAPHVEAELRVLGEVVDWDEDKIWHHSRPSPMEFEVKYQSPEAMTQVGDQVVIVIGGRRVMTICTEAEIDATFGCYLARYREIGKETV